MISDTDLDHVYRGIGGIMILTGSDDHYPESSGLRT